MELWLWLWEEPVLLPLAPQGGGPMGAEAGWLAAAAAAAHAGPTAEHRTAFPSFHNTKCHLPLQGYFHDIHLVKDTQHSDGPKMQLWEHCHTRRHRMIPGMCSLQRGFEVTEKREERKRKKDRVSLRLQSRKIPQTFLGTVETDAFCATSRTGLQVTCGIYFISH